jgi:hypothetical protein
MVVAAEKVFIAHIFFKSTALVVFYTTWHAVLMVGLWVVIFLSYAPLLLFFTRLGTLC